MNASSPSPFEKARLYGILDLSYVALSDAEDMAGRMLRGGVEVLQLRAKCHEPSSLVALATSLARQCRDAGAPMIVNDHPALARDCGADGAHIGQEDGRVADARALLGAGHFVGKSTHSFEQAVAAAAERPDYLGYGPLFATPTKPDYHPVGLADIRRVMAALTLPVFCIGGIKLGNLPVALAAGARRVAIVSGILQAADVVAYCRSVRSRLREWEDARAEEKAAS